MGGTKYQTAMELLGGQLSNIRIAEELENDIPKENPTLGSLPLEIKNEIFSNLLLSTKVKYDCLTVGPRLKKYAFHTAIFRANKQLGAEATSYLYTHNNFAVVTHKYAGFENILADGCIPTIAPSLTMLFLHPAIFVNLKLTQTCTCGKNDCADPSEVAPRKKLLMLVDDLPVVISMLQIWYHVFCGSNTFILSDPEEEKITSASHCDETRAELRLRLKDNPFINLTRKEREVRQKKLVTPFTVIQNACQTVYVTGDVFPQVAKDVSQAMMPKIVWLNAVGWDLYDVVTHHKCRLDGILDESCMHWLGNIYEHIGLVACNNNALFACQIGEDTPLAIRSLPCDAVEVSKSWQFGVLVTGVDCLLVAAGLAMKCGYHPMVYDLATSILDAIEQNVHLQEAVPNSLKAFAYYYMGISTLRMMDPNAPLRACGALEDAVKLLPHNQALFQDLEMVKKICSGDFGNEYMIPELTKRPLGWKTELPNLTQPANLKGWINTSHHLTPSTVRMLEKRAEKQKIKVLAECKVRARQGEEMRAAMAAMEEVIMNGVMDMPEEEWDDSYDGKEEELDGDGEDDEDVPKLESVD